MQLSSRLFLSTLLLFVLSSQGLSQKRFCPVPPPSPFKHSGRIVTSFDRSIKGMRTTLEHPRALGKGTEGLYFAASFIHNDPRRPTTPTVELVFVSSSPVTRYRDSHNLVFFCDGQQLTINQKASYKSQTGEGGTALEATRISLSYADVLAITRSRKVSARVGATDVEFTNNHLEALRELVSLIAPPAGRWGAEE
ncbi:MAG: hypothetical protein LC802_08430 [Acidobacteria bacterium]|nr:hypothetical protein [Acidobacteriota bacterium]